MAASDSAGAFLDAASDTLEDEFSWFFDTSPPRVSSLQPPACEGISAHTQAPPKFPPVVTRSFTAFDPEAETCRLLAALALSLQHGKQTLAMRMACEALCSLARACPGAVCIGQAVDTRKVTLHTQLRLNSREDAKVFDS
jgi:hypothetical protein